jgi:hypothetical protein
LNTDSKSTPGGNGSKQSYWRDVVLTPPECTSQRVLQLHDYWQGLRRGRSIPSRSDIDPVAIWSLLPNIHVSEWHHDPDRVRCRLAGTEIVAALGFEIRGRWLHEFHRDAQDLAETIALFRRVEALRAPIIGRTFDASGRLGVDTFEWVLCPLAEDDGAVTHFIGLEDYVSTKRYLGGTD